MRDPVESATTQPPQGRYILGQQHQAERQHPYAEKRQNAEGAAAEQQPPAVILTQRDDGRRSQRVGVRIA